MFVGDVSRETFCCLSGICCLPCPFVLKAADMPKLFLIPTPLAAPDTPCLLPHEAAQIAHLTDFVVEDAKTARACLRHLGIRTPVRALSLSLLNGHTPADALPDLLRPLHEGRDLGLVSEAGCPAVADPGADLVALAHARGFDVCPLVGPSSIMLALMASGANGQCFAFKGYLPADAEGRAKRLKQLQQRSRTENETQLFIETPYRNQAVLTDAVALLDDDTLLCTATELTSPQQQIISQSIRQWRNLPELPNLKKRPTLFVLHGGAVTKSQHLCR